MPKIVIRKDVIIDDYRIDCIREPLLDYVMTTLNTHDIPGKIESVVIDWNTDNIIVKMSEV